MNPVLPSPTLPAPAPTNMAGAVNQDFCLIVLCEGKKGTECFRKLYSEITSYDDLVEFILEKYFSDANNGEETFESIDFLVRIKDVSDPSCPINIKDTKDLALAVKFQAEGQLKLQAVVSDLQEVMAQEREPQELPELRQEEVAPVPALVVAPGAVVSPPVVAVGGKQKTVAKAPKASKVGRPGNKTGKSPRSKAPVRTRIIGSLAELRALGSTSPPRIEVAMFAGYGNANSKGFTNPLSALKTEGIIMYPDSKTVALTDKGLDTEEAKGVSPPKNNDEVHARIKAFLTPKQVEIFNKLAGGIAEDRDELALSVGYTNVASKGFSNSVGKMSSLGIVQYLTDPNDRKKKSVQLTDMCFPFSKGSASIPISPFRASTPPLSSPADNRPLTYV